MDRIEQLMKDAKPRVGVPGSAPGSRAARSIVYSTDPNVVRLAGRTPARRTAARTAVATALAAAAVVGAVVLGGNLMPQPAPGPAQTGSPTPASPSPSAAAPTATPTQTSALSTGGVACTPANIDQLRNDQQRTITPIPPAEQGYYTVLGCADGWLAYSISDDGARTLRLDGGNAWFRLARLEDGRFLWDVRQEWATVFNWEFQATNNQGLTPQQAMDKEFATKGIPVELRPRLVGEGPAAG
ncbi:hypothetical protein NicSoilB4_13020 [Arthrobacter sp. NicSoilB4]|uniref:hypothetical protein n=1 Tax=Arthrobacter sp. NicSoilB4 TaxID=2830997 RepID=UPI001CC35212|nr:hypothetical protein [Arthrobacter sp. NicSoilB4]BCW66539.1 hypothetical protein NicSoilB4_13020 [Arthrobacter sp. NicSoilB4]